MTAVFGYSGMTTTDFWSRYRKATGQIGRGNMKGEGRLLGGVLVVGPGETGVVYDYREKEFGDHAPVEEVVEAVEKIGNADYSSTDAMKKRASERLSQEPKGTEHRADTAESVPVGHAASDESLNVEGHVGTCTLL